MPILPLFPKAGFDESATTPVLLGVLVSWGFTEAFGWVFAGLVVPGYLAALFLLDPRSASIDVFEAVVTYALARAIGEHLARTGLTSRLFGRERFFLVVLVSILVRLAVEAALLPKIAPHATWTFSIGLVVVPLAANACWKTGLWRGVVQNGVPVLIVYVLLRAVLMPFTNLSLASFNLATENIAASFLASPKAYILLLTGAVIAALANLRYGWDYSGILIPALLGLVVIHPVKLAATAVEVVVLLVVVRLLLQYTPMKRWNVEGPRRPVLFFTVDYALRFAFAWGFGTSLPGADVVDLMGFGYLLPTLLAVKASQKQIAPLVLLPALTVAAASFAVGTGVGFAALALDASGEGGRATVQRAVPAAPADPAAAALWVAALARPAPAPGAFAAELRPARVAALVDELIADRAAPLPEHLVVQPLDHGVLLVRERFESLETRIGDPAILVRASGPRSPAAARVVALVDRPLGAPEAAALAGSLLGDGALDAVVIAGAQSDATGPFAVAPPAIRVARALADAHRARGVVLVLDRSRDDTPRARIAQAARADARVRALLDTLTGRSGDVTADAAEPERDADVRVELPLARAERWLPPPPAPVSLAGSASLAMLVDDERTPAPPPAVEDVLALRRLVLEPLLASDADRPMLPVARLAAQSLGYVLHGPSPLGDGDEGLALLPGVAWRPLAVVARAHGVRRIVVEAPHGGRTALCDLALRLGTALAADAIVIGFASGSERWLGDPSVREAGAFATAPAPNRDASVVLVRDEHDEPSDTSAVVSSWGGADASAFTSDVERALDRLGLTSSRAPLDPPTREGVGRGVLGDTRLVSVAVGRRGQRTASLGGARAMMRAFASFPVLDGECGDAAARLAAALSQDSPPAPADLDDVVRRAAAESSVTARRALEAYVAAKSTSAGLVSAVGGVYLVAVGRDARGAFDIVAAPTSPIAPYDATIRAEKSIAACGARIARGGRCRAESR